MSLVLQDPSSASSTSLSAGVKVDTVVGGVTSSNVQPGATTGGALQWDYSPKSMDADGATSNGATCGDESVIELNGDCSADDAVSLAQTAIIKQVRPYVCC